MGIFVKLKGYGKEILGASWASPLRTAAAVFGAGGGDYHSPVSFTATPTDQDKATLSGVSPTITNSSQFRAVRAYAADGSLVGEWRPSRSTPFNYNSLTSVLSVKGANWKSAAYLDVELHAEHRGYAPTEDAYQHYDVNPNHAHVQPVDMVAVTDETDSTIYYYIDFDSYHYGGFQLDLDCDAGTVTATLEGSYEDNGTAQAAVDYQDVTSDLFGVASIISAAAPAADMWAIDTPESFKFLRVKIVYATGGNTGDATVRFRGTY